jgi:cubilin
MLFVACGGHLTSAEGSFTNPGYPLTYPPSTECIWTINTSPGNNQYYMNLILNKP